MSPRRSQGASTSRDVSAMAVARRAENLQSLYTAWAELRLARSAAALARRAERDKLETKASYLLNAVAAARAFAAPASPAPPPKSVKGKPGSKVSKSRKLAPAPTSNDPLKTFHAQAEAELQAATSALETRERQEESQFAAQDLEVRSLILQRADQHLQIHRPRLALAVHPVGSGKVIVQAQGLGEEDAVLLLRLLFGRLPTRWGFFSDDPVEQLGDQSSYLYPDDEAPKADSPSSPDEADQLMKATPDFSPVRQQLPIWIPDREFPRFRLIHRGPVAELESRREGVGYQQVVPQQDAELLTGFLLSLKLRSILNLDVEVG